MINYNKSSQYNSTNFDFNRLKLGLKWAHETKSQMQLKFNKLKMLLTSYLKNPYHLRIDNNTKYRIY
jgi:hypothetical protein